MAEVERKGLRFEVFPQNVLGPSSPAGGVAIHQEWVWVMVGVEGPLAKSFTTYDTEALCRSDLAANKGRLGNAKRAKVITLNAEPEDYFR